MRSFLRTLLDDKSAVTAIEYGLIAGLIAVVIIAIITTVGTDLANLFNAVSGGLQDATTNAN
ncbi:MAG: Flp family type IVb pilin [Alphaproteobacteria bacterium]|nr:Flp family type IVb pilin [Alphaproteobacteria bacterium]|tara:strand:+ start:117 stop:302 length:186 start_codon:yes stop_codon:yes gene_type:complete